MRGLHLLVAQAVEHILHGPAGQRQRPVAVQAMLHQCAAGDVLVHLAVNHGAGALRRNGRRTWAGGGRSLQRGHGIFGAQAEQAVVKAAGNVGLRAGCPARRATPGAGRAGAPPARWRGRPIPPARGRARARSGGALRGACASMSPSNWRVWGVSSSGGGTGGPDFLQGVQQVGHIDLGRAIRCARTTGYRPGTLPSPERAIAKNQDCGTD